mmetsp:Transcript_9811/g.8338  ORF Transcript_9811/g.8338 Transcript_9811/m.8338 type:complete len:120 (+) Transcript_9811:141-500(+)
MIKIDVDGEKLPVGVDGCTLEDGGIVVRNSGNNQAPISIVLCPCSLMKHMKNKKCDDDGPSCEPTSGICGIRTETAQQGSAGSSCQTEASWLVPCKHDGDLENNSLADEEAIASNESEE